MKSTNQQKWDYYKGILDKKAAIFIQNICGDLPEKVYSVYPSGIVKEMFITGSHYTYEFNTYFLGKKPKKEDVSEIQKNATSEIEFNPDRIYFDYYYLWGDGGSKASSSIKYTDIAKGVYYLSKDEADTKAAIVLQANAEEKLFKETHKKDKSYNYISNGYVFLGWQNGWKSVSFDADGNITTDNSKAVYFGYSSEDYPVYGKCREAKHRVIEVSHNQSGSENTVSCPECMIFWKYDCSG